jgi:hypothetical protein
VSRRFAVAAAQQPKVLMLRSLGCFEWTALMLDGLRFGYRLMPKLVIALHDLDTEKKMTALRKAG